MDARVIHMPHVMNNVTVDHVQTYIPTKGRSFH